MSKINETNYPRRTQANYASTDMLVIQAAGGNTYTTRLEDMREDYEETLAPTLSALQDDVNENLATIEGSTASKAYAKGDFLVFGGRLCKAKTSIASGATLVLDTNIELDSVGDELSSISSHLTVQTLTFTDYVSYASGVTASSSGNSLYKMGNLILLNMTFKSPSSGTFLDVAALDNSIKPRANLNIMAYDWTDNKAVGAATVGASVRLYGVTSGHDYSLNITYPV